MICTLIGLSGLLSQRSKKPCLVRATRAGMMPKQEQAHVINPDGDVRPLSELRDYVMDLALDHMVKKAAAATGHLRVGRMTVYNYPKNREREMRARTKRLCGCSRVNPQCWEPSGGTRVMLHKRTRAGGEQD